MTNNVAAEASSVSKSKDTKDIKAFKCKFVACVQLTSIEAKTKLSIIHLITVRPLANIGKQNFGEL